MDQHGEPPIHMVHHIMHHSMRKTSADILDAFFPSHLSTAAYFTFRCIPLVDQIELRTVACRSWNLAAGDRIL